MIDKRSLKTTFAAILLIGFSAFILPIRSGLAQTPDANTLAARKQELQTADADMNRARTDLIRVSGGAYQNHLASERNWTLTRNGNCFGSVSPIIRAEIWTFISSDQTRYECWLRMTRERTAALRKVVEEAKTGTVSPEALKAVDGPFEKAMPAKTASQPALQQSAPNPAPPPAAVNPLNGSGAKIERTAKGATLTYSDAGGTRHSYPVTRPKFAQSMLGNSDLGAWIYVAEDRQSGVTFNIAASGQVSGSALNPIMLKMAVGP